MSDNSLLYVEHPLKIKGLGLVQLTVFPHGQGSGFVYGNPEDGTLVRIQSACQYGEIFGSIECDCRPQLDAAIELMHAEGSGILVHLLDQEGRGAGLAAKARAYQLQASEGIDTFTSSARLELEADSRNYAAVAAFLHHRLGLRNVRLLTNNPEKIAALRGAGIEVDRVPLIDIRPESSEYFWSKLRHGHLGHT